MPIALTGFNELLDAMGDIESLVARKKIFVTAGRKSLEPLLDRMKLLAPDDTETPGNIIRKFARKAVLNQSATGVLLKVGDTPSGFPGYFKEWGTHHEEQQQFLEVALNETQDQVEALLTTELWAGITGQLIEEQFDA